MLRFRLMVKRGPRRPQASEGEAQHGAFCGTGRFGQGDQRLHGGDTGKIVREVKVASEPDALLAVLKNPAYHFKRIGLEAGPLSQWLFSALAEAGLPVICVETRHMRAALKAQINKTDRNDARGMAQMMRVGLYRPVHVKTLRSQKTADAADPPQAAAVEGDRRLLAIVRDDEVCRRLMTTPGVGPALLSRSTTAAGAFFGTAKPSHEIAS